MDEFVKSLDSALDYLTHETHEQKIIITVESGLHETICPYCSKTSSRVHSVYQREFQDLPLQDKQVTIILNNKNILVITKTVIIEPLQKDLILLHPNLERPID